MGDLLNTPVPNGPHTKRTVVNGNVTNDSYTTQPHYIGNGPAAISPLATPSYPIRDPKEALNYAQQMSQVTAPVKAVAAGDLLTNPIPNGPHTTRIVVNGNTTTDSFTT
jgi:hypothetical protein